MAAEHAWNEHRGSNIVAHHIGAVPPGRKASALLPILHAIQAEFGHIPDPAIALIAGALNLSRADVHGVVTFYHDFRRSPPGRHIVKLCRAEACQAMGGNALADNLRNRLNIDWGETTPDGRVTLEPVFCLGLCACAPAAMIDGRTAGRLDDAKLRSALDGAGP